MTPAERFLDYLGDLGLTFRVVEDLGLAVGPKRLLTRATRQQIREMVDDLADVIRGRGREWLWRTGHVEQEGQGDETVGQWTYHRATAWWWRHQGETVWREVPERPVQGKPEEPCYPDAQLPVAPVRRARERGASAL